MKRTIEKELIEPTINLVGKTRCIITETYNKIQSLTPWSTDLNVILAVSQLVKFMFPLFKKTEIPMWC
jgi:hypothetical protein